MKKKIIYFIGFIFSIITFTTISSVYAENENSEKESKASILFKMNTGPTLPVDPEDPGNPLPGEPTPTEGQLAIVYVSDFDFGSSLLSFKNQSYDIVTEFPNIQVVDLRTEGYGWKLEASVGPLTGTDSGTTLRGAEIHIKNGHLYSEMPIDYEPIVSSNIVLTTDGQPKRIMTAEPGTGQGFWLERLYPPTEDENEDQDKYITLEIPADVIVADTYSATITWTLAKTP